MTSFSPTRYAYDMPGGISPAVTQYLEKEIQIDSDEK